MAKKRKHYDDDDGRTIVDMNVEGMPWYQPGKTDKKVDKEDQPKRKERRAMVRGAYLAYLPIFLAFLCGIGIAAVLLYFWLK